MLYNFGTFLDDYFYTLVGDEPLPPSAAVTYFPSFGTSFAFSIIDNVLPLVSLPEVPKATCYV